MFVAVVLCMQMAEQSKSAELEVTKNDIPDDSFAVALSEMRKLDEEQKNGKVVCSACSRHSTGAAKLAAAVVFCVVCEDKLCKPCTDAHRKLKITTDHRLVPFDKDFITNMSEARRSKPTFCQEHDEQACLLYCQNPECRKPICLKCAVSRHKTHDYTDVALVAKDMRKELLHVAEALRGKLAHFTEQSQRLEKRKNLIRKSTNEVQTLLGQKCDDVQSLIEKGRREFFSSVQDICGQNTQSLREASTALNSRLSDLNSVLVFGQDLSKNGNDVEISCLLQQFRNKADQVRLHQSSDLPEKLDLMPVFNAEWQTTDIFREISAAIGSVTTAANSTSTEYDAANKTYLAEDAESGSQQSTPEVVVRPKEVANKPRQHPVSKWYSQSPRLVGKIKGKNPVRGIALIGKQLFVVHRSESCINVYDTDSLAFLGSIEVTGLESPTDMVACSTTRRIYISDKSHLKVICVKLFDNCKTKIHDLSMKITMQPFGLSVTPKCHVLVAHLKNECFAEYTADLCQVRVIKTPGLTPFHVVFLADNCFVTCGGDSSNLVSICVLGERQNSAAAGNALAACSHQLGIFKRPTHVAVDTHGGIFVVDSHQHRVVVTDSKLSKTLCTIRDQYTCGLEKCCLNTDASELYVGIANCMNNVTVSVYSL